MAFQFNNKLMKLLVTEMEAASLDALKGGDKSSVVPHKTEIGLLLPDAAVCFNRADGLVVPFTCGA